MIQSRHPLLFPFRRILVSITIAALIASLLTMAPSLFTTPVMAVAGTCPGFTDHHYIGNRPQGIIENIMSNELQGVAHDPDYWYFTQRERIWALPISAWSSLSEDPPLMGPMFMPSEMGALGYDHFGDLDHYEGYLFVPVEKDGSYPALAVFRASDGSFVDWVDLRGKGEQGDFGGQTQAAWVAVDPHPDDGNGIFLYMSNNELSDASPLYRYRLNFDLFSKTEDLEWDVTLTFDSRVKLYEENWDPITDPFLTMQGGVFSPWGDLYLINSKSTFDFSTGRFVGRGGIHVFDAQTHKRLASSAQESYTFEFEFSDGLTYTQEPEGIDWWNLGPSSPLGQLHVILLQNELDSDDFYFKHYWIDYWCVENLDSDNDGLIDGTEAFTYSTDPRDNDTDTDGLSDGIEVNTLSTDPLSEDTDNDGVPDGSEDNDSDGLSNLTEVSGSNPTNPVDGDSDDDGLLDGAEDSNHNGALDTGETNPNDPDSDDDVLTDGCEVLGANPTNPVLKDTDGDGLEDSQEDTNHNCVWDLGETDPSNADTDADQLDDGLELQHGTNPLDPDTDDDMLSDGEDVANGCNPLATDTDGDTLTDFQEVKVYGTFCYDKDTDDDELDDGFEVAHATDPVDSDTDNDGVKDGEDVEWLQNAIDSMPDSVFKSPASSLKDAMTTILDDVEQAVARGDIDSAMKLLDNLRRHIDGCGLMADANDWVLECTAQVQIRELVDTLITNLSS